MTPLNPAKIWSSQQLPSLPSVAVRLLELSKDPDAGINEVVQAIKTDPAITAKIIKAANSSYFCTKVQVTSIERAVPLLGTTVVTTLALSFSLVDAAMTTGPLAAHYSTYWKQSIVQAVAGEVLAEKHAKNLASDCFLSGLLLDLGRLAMLKTVSSNYLPVLSEWTEKGGHLHELETAQLGINHMEIGAQLLENWKVPESLCEAIKIHHTPLPQLEHVLGKDPSITKKAVLISATVGDYFCTASKGLALERLRKLAADLFGYSEQMLTEYLELTRARIDKAGDLFVVNFDEMGDAGDVMAEASEQLAKLVVHEHTVNTQMEIQQGFAEQAKAELESKNQELQRKVSQDALTGLYNRAFFAEALQKAIENGARNAQAVGLIFTDIDHFKRLNDTYGHPFGDEVLREVAKVYRATIRSTDVVARYGGEEFVILINQPTEKGLEKIAERVRAAVEAMVVKFEGNRVPVTISVGAAVALPERNPQEVDKTLISNADEAMYQSKQTGRNRVHVRTLLDPIEQRLAGLVAQRRFSRWLVQRNIFDVATVSRALLDPPKDKPRIGAIACRFGILSEQSVETILAEQQLTGKRFGRCALDLKFLTDDQLAMLLALQVEPPSGTANVLIQEGLLDRAHADALLGEYRNHAIQSCAPPQTVRV